MPELAENVTVDLARKKLFVNGAEFPWHISEEGPKLGGIMAANEIRSVTLTFYAKDIEVIPEGPLSVEEAQRRVEQAQRELCAAQEHLKGVHTDVAKAQREFKAAQDEAERLVEDTR